jgi:hypothetical protein
MVNTVNVGRFDECDPPPLPWGQRPKISKGPLYRVDELLAILETTKPRPVTRQSIRDMTELGFDEEEFRRFCIAVLTSGTYRDSEWCELGRDGQVAACDAYCYLDRHWNEFAHKELPCSYYLKVAIAADGCLVLVVSCHKS